MSRYDRGSVAPSVEITSTDELSSTPRLAPRATAPDPVKHCDHADRACGARFPRDKVNLRELANRSRTQESLIPAHGSREQPAQVSPAHEHPVLVRPPVK